MSPLRAIVDRVGRFTLACTLLLPVLAAECVSQPLSWQDLSGSSGYETFVQSGTGMFFATNYRGIIYQSTDNGVSFPSILAYPSSTKILELVVNGDHLVTRLDDPGVSGRFQILLWTGVANVWARILATSFRYYQRLMINDSGVVYGVDPFAAHPIVRFDGVSWSAMGTPQVFFSPTVFDQDLQIVTAIDHSNNIVVGSPAGGVYVSGDYGNSWVRSLQNYPVSAINVTLPNTIIVGTTPSPIPPLNTFGGIFASTDSGRSWRALGLSNHTISSLVARRSGRLYALADGGAYKRVDSSGAWQFISPPGRQSTALAVIGADSIQLSSETGGTVLSTDDGATWSGADIRGRDVFAIAQGSSGTLFAGTLGSGVFRSSPTGFIWSQLPSGSTGEYVYAFTATGASLYAGTNRGVYRTTDEGQSWLSQSAPFVSGSAYSLAVLPDGSLFAGTGFGVYRSTDSGSSWTQSGLPVSKVFYLSAGSTGTLYAGTATDGVYASTDDGSTWSGRGLVRNDLQTLVVNGAGSLFAGVYGGIFRSTDDGATWQNFSFGSGYVYAIVPAGSQTLFAGTHTGIYASSDGGGTWVAAGNTGLQQDFVLSLALDAENHVLAGTYRGSIYRSDQQVTGPVVSGVAVSPYLPRTPDLAQNYPNPFNPTTEIRFQVPAGVSGGSFVNLRVFDIAGREIAVLVNERKPPGVYTVSWDAAGRPSGVYFYQLRVVNASHVRGGDYLASKKMLLIR